MCGLTDGNLSRHLQGAAGAGSSRSKKGLQQQSAGQTVLPLTPQGRQRYLDYLEVLEQVVARRRTAPPRARVHRPISGGSSPS